MVENVIINLIQNPSSQRWVRALTNGAKYLFSFFLPLPLVQYKQVNRMYPLKGSAKAMAFKDMIYNMHVEPQRPKKPCVDIAEADSLISTIALSSRFYSSTKDFTTILFLRVLS